jgi:hypothetical protein
MHIRDRLKEVFKKRLDLPLPNPMTEEELDELVDAVADVLKEYGLISEGN